MELFLRDNDLTDWIELESGVSLKIAYPTYEQEKEISSKFVDCMGTDIEVTSKPYVDYYSLLVRYCVKDWKGISDLRTKEPIPCKVANNELSTDLMAALVRDPLLITDWGGRIKTKIDFTETDKKK